MKDCAKIPLLVVGGPTASGKTWLAVELAKKLDGEIICADSMQVYREMNVGTATPTPEERQGVPHHLFDIIDPGDSFSVAEYLKLARASIADISARGRLPVLCGGTGLYISSLIDNIGLDDGIPENPAIRNELRALALDKGNKHLWGILRECDPELADTLHPNNLRRVIRAVEVYRQTVVPMSEWQRRSRSAESPYKLCYIALRYRDRELLYRRINARVDMMLEQGLLGEVESLLDKGFRTTAMQAIGYKELAGYLRGEQSLEESVETLKRSTRRYAKRQLTWLRRDGRVRWLEPDAFESNDALLTEALTHVQHTLLPTTNN